MPHKRMRNGLTSAQVSQAECVVAIDKQPFTGSQLFQERSGSPSAWPFSHVHFSPRIVYAQTSNGKENQRLKWFYRYNIAANCALNGAWVL